MAYLAVKIFITSAIVVITSEIAKQSSFLGSILASVPLVSVLAMTWLYIDTKDVLKVIDLSRGIFWLVIPSLTLFLVLPILLKYGISFYASLFISIVTTVVSYYLLILGLNQFGIKL
jgi:hypothetical protein|tara:strand:+ start:1014 stop:1364 length:351 start_codon:yes stop_codon:yes gene_type:complete